VLIGLGTSGPASWISAPDRVTDTANTCSSRNTRFVIRRSPSVWRRMQRLTRQHRGRVDDREIVGARVDEERARIYGALGGVPPGPGSPNKGPSISSGPPISMSHSIWRTYVLERWPCCVSVLTRQECSRSTTTSLTSAWAASKKMLLEQRRASEVDYAHQDRPYLSSKSRRQQSRDPGLSLRPGDATGTPIRSRH
jgi:hypothetical protein